MSMQASFAALTKAAMVFSGDLRKTVTLVLTGTRAYDPDTGTFGGTVLQVPVLALTGPYDTKEIQDGRRQKTDLCVRILKEDYVTAMTGLSDDISTDDFVLIDGVKYNVYEVTEDLARTLLTLCARVA
jgi:hypothetical protein